MTYKIDRNSKEPAYLQLYRQLREDILKDVYKENDKLPSKRLIASELGISVITVGHALELLADEGYIETRQRSGCFVIYRETDGFSAQVGIGETPVIKQQQAGENSSFPFSVYARTMRKVIGEYDAALLEKSPSKGVMELRTAIASYLAKNRGMTVSPDQVIIGAGAEYLYGILVQVLGRSLAYAIEMPSYEKIEQVYRANDVKLQRLALGPEGILSDELQGCSCDVLHISPYRSYPSGVTASASKRQEYIRWAGEKPDRFIIEDDFESEFTPSTKPDDTVFAMSGKENVIYLNTFSKTVAPSVRTGYMVLPRALLPVYDERAGFYSCAVPTFEQLVLARFISEGDFERHINRVRRAGRKALAERGEK